LQAMAPLWGMHTNVPRDRGERKSGRVTRDRRIDVRGSGLDLTHTVSRVVWVPLDPIWTALVPSTQAIRVHLSKDPPTF
jgi:hypothetical protein